MDSRSKNKEGIFIPERESSLGMKERAELHLRTSETKNGIQGNGWLQTGERVNRGMVGG